MGRACSMHGGYKNVYTILVGQPDDKRLGIDRRII
jgi:hypothetical protein